MVHWARLDMLVLENSLEYISTGQLLISYLIFRARLMRTLIRINRVRSQVTPSTSSKNSKMLQKILQKCELSPYLCHHEYHAVSDDRSYCLNAQLLEGRNLVQPKSLTMTLERSENENQRYTITMKKWRRWYSDNNWGEWISRLVK